MEKKHQNELETLPVGRLMRRYSLPCVISLLVGFAALLIVELLPRQLIAVFGATRESAYYTEFGVKAFRIYLCMLLRFFALDGVLYSMPVSDALTFILVCIVFARTWRDLERGEMENCPRERFVR